ncbi:sulfatase-like hydrolase/transferase, partial [Psychromonas sp. Urea-02u-13]|uniref:sulfatase-like hydrolase/transferase n=1 Tax=Psychromonas sp. Urea-02u-13 TaxID=2058326 RepID=UPI000CBE4886
MLNTLRFLILSTLFVILASCGGGSTEEAEDPIVIPVEIPVEPPAEDDNELVQPNILFIISDDQGLDASAQYDFSDDVPQTPTLNMLGQQGITFENMWVTPACSTTRSTIITGKYGVNNGVESLPGNLSAEHEILQQYLKTNATSDNYQSAVFGKWH